MAQTLILRALKRALSSYVGDKDLDAQVGSGTLSLSKVELKPRRVLQGLWAFCVIGEVQAEWCWKRLLTSRFEVCLSDVSVVIRLPPPGADWPLGCEQEDDILEVCGSNDEAENFLNRLKRRIWDRLQIKVKNLHVRLECYANQQVQVEEVGGVWRGTSMGCIAHEFEVVPSEIAPGKPIQQTVSLQNCGAYAEECHGTLTELIQSTSMQWPSQESCIISGFSPYCMATRYSGRRFVDWLGLEVELHIVCPAVNCNRQNWRDLMLMLMALSSPGFKDAAAKPPQANTQMVASKSSSMQPSQAPSAPFPERCKSAADASQTSQPDGWRRWVRALWASEPMTTQSLGTKLPSGVSAADCAVLLEEEQEPRGGDTLKLIVELETAKLRLPDVNLSATLSAGGEVTIFGKDSWEGNCAVREIEVSEADQPEDGMVVFSSSSQPCAAETFEEEYHILEISGKRKDLTELRINLAPVRLHVSQVLAQGVQDAARIFSSVYDTSTGTAVGSTTPADAESIVSTDGLAPSFAVEWKAEEIVVVVGDPWLEGSKLSTRLNGNGLVSPHGGTSRVSVAMDWQHAGSRKMVPFLESASVEADLGATGLRVNCTPLRLRSCLRDVLLLQTAAASASAACRQMLPSRQSSSFRALGQHALEVEASQIELILRGAESTEEWWILLTGSSLKCQRSASGVHITGNVLKARATDCGANVRTELKASVDLLLGGPLLIAGSATVDDLQIVDMNTPGSILLRPGAPSLNDSVLAAEDVADQAGKSAALLVAEINEPSQDGLACGTVLNFALKAQSVTVCVTKGLVQTLRNVVRIAKALEHIQPQCRSSQEEVEGLKVERPSSHWPTWEIRWTQLQPAYVITGGAWLLGAEFVAELTSSGVFRRSGGCEISGLLGLSLQDEEDGDTCHSRWLDSNSFTMDVQWDKVSIHFPTMFGRCPVHELVAVARVVRKCLMERDPSDDEFARLLPVHNISISALHIVINDVEQRDCAIQGRELEMCWAGQASLLAAHLEVNLLSGGDLQGSIQLDDALATAKIEGCLICTFKAAHAELLDGEGHRAATGVGSSGTIKYHWMWTPPLLNIEAAPCETATLDVTKDFAASCKSCGEYVAATLGAVFMEPVMLEDRPFGMRLVDDVITSVSGRAHESGVVAGSTLKGIVPRPEAGTTAADHLASCSLPVFLLLELPARQIQANVSLSPFPLTASLRTRWGIEMGVQKANLPIQPLILQNWVGNCMELHHHIRSFYHEQLHVHLPQLAAAFCIGGVPLGRVAAKSVGILKQGGNRAVAVPGTVVQGLSVAARAGREQRGSTGYRFGDISRGAVALARAGDGTPGNSSAFRGFFDDCQRMGRVTSKNKTQRGSSRSPTREDGKPSPHGCRWDQSSSPTEASPLHRSLSGISGVSSPRREPSDRMERTTSKSSTFSQVSTGIVDGVHRTVSIGKLSRGVEESDRYRFGDAVRGLMAEGKRARGEQPDANYKFGDVTKGLFKTFKRRGT